MVGRELWEGTRFKGGLQFCAELLVLSLVEGEIGIIKHGLFLSGDFPGCEVGDKGEAGLFVQGEEIRLDLAGAHQVNAREEDPVDVEQRLYPAERLFEE